jgi:ATP-dependent Zn protease
MNSPLKSETPSNHNIFLGELSLEERCIRILEVHARGMKLAPNLDLLVIAANTSGLSGAQLIGV